MSDDISLLSSKLSALRSRYFNLLDELEMFSRIGIQSKSLETECWDVRREAYTLLVKVDKEGWLLSETATGFGWTIDQVRNASMQAWLCKDIKELCGRNANRLRGNHLPFFRD